MGGTRAVREEPGKQKLRRAFFASRLGDCGRGNSPEAAPKQMRGEKGRSIPVQFNLIRAKRAVTGGEKEAHFSCLARAAVIASVTEDIVSKPSDLVQGTLDMLLLKILALELMNGFEVSQRLKQVSGDVLQVSDGSLYPALHKLEQEGWITAEWKTSEKGRRAKYYSLTRLGRGQLEREADNWSRLSSAISRVVKLREA
jgi:PadR family transcriptional regulator